MEDLLIAAGVVGLLYLAYKKLGPGLVPTLTPAPPVPLAPGIPGGTVIVGGAYGVPPWSTTVGAGGAVTPVALPSTVNPLPGLPPPPPVAGGIGGGPGSSGLPLGGPITPGVSTGTGTTDIFGRAPIGGSPGFDYWGRSLSGN